MLYCFAFPPCSQILSQLLTCDKKTVVNPREIDAYIQILLEDQPTYVLGLGSYSGIDQDKIRIETLAKNKFRNTSIDASLPMLQNVVINPFVQTIPQTKITSGLGNSWCNVISWKIAQLIVLKKLHSQFAFLHIPKKFDGERAAVIINDLLD